MKIEKLNEDKIRITLNREDLVEKDIDFHSFMANSLESQELFLDMLDEAEKEVGFVTDDYKIMIEALAMSNGNFILTVTRLVPETETGRSKKKKVHIKRKVPNFNIDKTIYRFSSFEDFCNFCSSLNNDLLTNLSNFVENTSLYFYENRYYLVFTKLNNNFEDIKSFTSAITEFAHFVNISTLFERKLLEYGEVIIPNNAIGNCIKYF